MVCKTQQNLDNDETMQSKLIKLHTHKNTHTKYRHLKKKKGLQCQKKRFEPYPSSIYINTSKLLHYHFSGQLEFFTLVNKIVPLDHSLYLLFNKIIGMVPGSNIVVFAIQISMNLSSHYFRMQILILRRVYLDLASSISNSLSLRQGILQPSNKQLTILQSHAVCGFISPRLVKYLDLDSICNFLDRICHFTFC